MQTIGQVPFPIADYNNCNKMRQTPEESSPSESVVSLIAQVAVC